MRRARDPITDLRRAIDLLPAHTREAMLDGIRANPIVVGAYTDDQGGICPMLAAHRHGGRTTLLAFARSWDALAGDGRVRRATRRELTILETELEASLQEGAPIDLRTAIADHERLKARAGAAGAQTAREAEATGRTHPEITARRLRPRRRAADAQRALERLQRVC